jgi:hypothetical protein
MTQAKVTDILTEIQELLTNAIVEDAVITIQTAATVRVPFRTTTDQVTLPGSGGQAYAAQDEVSDNATGGSATPLNFADAVSAVGGSGFIVKAVIEASTATVANAVFRLWLFNAAPTMYGNDSPYQLDAADKAKRVGYVDFALITEGTGSDSAYGLDDGLRMAFTCDAADADLYGVLVAKAGYVWTNAQTFDITLTIEEA